MKIKLIAIIILLVLFSNVAWMSPLQLPSAKGITLGAKYSDVLEKWGNPSSVRTQYKDGCGVFGFQKDYFLTFFENKRIHEISLQFDKVLWIKKLTKEEVNDIIKDLLPKDAKFIDKYINTTSTPGKLEVYLYRSNSISNYFEDEYYYDVNKEESIKGLLCVVINFNEKGKIYRTSIATGNIVPKDEK